MFMNFKKGVRGRLIRLRHAVSLRGGEIFKAVGFAHGGPVFGPVLKRGVVRVFSSCSQNSDGHTEHEVQYGWLSARPGACGKLDQRT